MEVEAAYEYFSVQERRQKQREKKKRLYSEIDDAGDLLVYAHKRSKQDPHREATIKQLVEHKTALVIKSHRVSAKERECHLALAQVRAKYQKTDFLLAHSRYHTKKVFLTHIAKQCRANILNLQITASVMPRLAMSSVAGVMTRIGLLQKEMLDVALKYDTLPLKRCLFAIPHRTLPLAYHPHRTHLCLDTGSILSDVWQYILNQYVKCRATLRLLRLVSVSFAIMVHSLGPSITGYVLKL